MPTLERLQTIFREIFDDEAITLTRETTPDHIAQWDSMNHVNLIVTIEEEFDVFFSASQAAGFANVGELVDILTKIT